jgi:pimeloyl-ACP methyl ester carboxylesterase
MPIAQAEMNSSRQIQQSMIEVSGAQMFIRHNGFLPSRKTILFIHGIGESGLCFSEAFHALPATEFNILVPDLPGFGKSSSATDGDYSFARQIPRLLELLEQFGIGEFHLVGHSMGGNIGTLLCQRHAEQVLSFVNIEGDLTADNRYLVDQALQADIEGRFAEWLRIDFSEKQIVQLSQRWPSMLRYLESLHLCNSQAFLSSAREIDKSLQPISGSNAAMIGKSYVELNTPRVYCFGNESLSSSGRQFLTDSFLRHQAFADAFHWVMLDQTTRFYDFLSGFLKTCDR